ncbi:MAG: DUF2752 domain-containing protein [Deltaproteobacteria bacterium]|nr:DUF2752 domain-containing protein [Deltaproteobacteria bacterium]
MQSLAQTAIRSPALFAPFRGRLAGLLILALVVPLPLLAYWAIPYVPGCVVRAALGLACPGCGLGRAICALFAGAPLRALALYPPLVMMVIAYLVVVGAASFRLVFGVGQPAAHSRTQRSVWVARWGIGTAAVILVHWIALLAQH